MHARIYPRVTAGALTFHDHPFHQFLPYANPLALDSPEQRHVAPACEQRNKCNGDWRRFEPRCKYGAGRLQKGEDEQSQEQGLRELVDDEGTRQDKVRPEVVALQAEPEMRAFRL